ncbi:hypothetical protein K439DRAFT_1620905 [Ramaria rubella]|nr:hypothetical protein K439DRAFT_1620905 [Ramaria rubella]
MAPSQSPDGPHSSDGNVVKSYDGSDLDQKAASSTPPPNTPYSDSLSFSLPASSDPIFFLSRGNYDHNSSLKIELASSSTQDVEVQVFVGYYNTAARDRARVSLLDRGGNGKGVGFFTPDGSGSIPDTDKVVFTVTVSLPNSGSPTNPLVIKALETNLGGWAHHVTDLKDKILFNSLSLTSANGLIQADSVSVVSGKFKANNGQISGSYTTSDSLSLSVDNSPITANIKMKNQDGSKPTHVEVNGQNSKVQTSISLVSTAKNSAFSVSVKTANGPLNVTFSEAPTTPYSLQFNGKTDNSPCDVKLPNHYQGSVTLSTASPAFERDMTKKPYVHVKEDKNGTLKATVGDGGKGSVVIDTTNNDIKVEVGEA